ncbi:hypothetical protein AXG93_1862s1430 [Marchantia polymorpha subsp. ruderalis]|uniref:Uncharacterized protein n=1 Tax=Marchantia polymorpha subsp. ruderalis TaxID=1480154 RepID=A0A176W9Y5_MARPO|nr:hypothetical protein AXG93_1862s1430 [Marchantia polymorpha subsp. ruderalis]
MVSSKSKSEEADMRVNWLGPPPGLQTLNFVAFWLTINSSKGGLYPCVAFQLHLSFEVNSDESGNKCGFTSMRDWDEEFSNGLKVIKQPRGSFEFISKRPENIIFVQAELSRILFARLRGSSLQGLIYSEGAATQIDQDRIKVYCVGRHSSPILSITVRFHGLALASATKDECLRVWRKPYEEDTQSGVELPRD